ncbi:OsmC family peroxiredoxin [Candidatus Berkiella aquae]|uniref:OsmC family protein n=1 Tax=Candidatus Berkiella aquae TaxID=295108 RepID=A0A0Q9YK55_9GAMM|nr:OsmC family protein [Candidatus Berkiella aquae]MCS5710000.1 OsmC family protein [Candidatus Berkiella aquae]
MKRTASAHWTGDLKQGKGQLTSESNVLKNTPYSFTTRFAGEKGTNPEELIAAAHAGCFTMALSAMLGQAGFVAESLQTQAVVELDQVEGNWTVTAIDLSLTGKIPGIDNTKFQELATQAKQNCPISRLLNTKISLKAELQ